MPTELSRLVGRSVQSFDELITPAVAKSTNMREAATLRQGLSITLGHLTTGCGFEDLIISNLFSRLQETCLLLGRQAAVE